MLRRRQINAKPGGRGIRPTLSASVDGLRRPFERLAWGFEQRVLWPLQERVVWPLRDRAAAVEVPGLRAAGAGALAVVAIGAAAVGVVALEGDGGAPRLTRAEPVAAVDVSPAPAPEPREEQTGPVLQGVEPEFGVGEGVGVAASGEGEAASAELNPGSDEEGDSGEEEAGATTSATKPVPAGPAAMKVARRFSEAFVFYEIGRRPARAMTVFGETATPELATALAERPPRQPASTEVPKAKVLNLVPGPRSGEIYTVSASLLRVGTVSELRLKLTKEAGAWLVTDVRG